MAAAEFTPTNVRNSTGVYLSAAAPEVVCEGALHVEVHGDGAYTRAVDNANQGGDWSPAPVGPVDLGAGQRQAWRWMGGASQVPLRIVKP
jgi:hypothetical protein